MEIQPNNPSKPAACTVVLTRFMQQNRQSAQPTEGDAACKFPPRRLPSKNFGFSMTGDPLAASRGFFHAGKRADPFPVLASSGIMLPGTK